MTRYIDNIIYASSQNGEPNTYDFQDSMLRSMIEVEEDVEEGAANAFYAQARQGFGSDNSPYLRNFSTAAAALESAIPRWKVCSS